MMTRVEPLSEMSEYRWGAGLCDPSALVMVVGYVGHARHRRVDAAGEGELLLVAKAVRRGNGGNG